MITAWIFLRARCRLQSSALYSEAKRDAVWIISQCPPSSQSIFNGTVMDESSCWHQCLHLMGWDDHYMGMTFYLLSVFLVSYSYSTFRTRCTVPFSSYRSLFVFSTGSKITVIVSLYWVHSNLSTGIELARGGDGCTCITAWPEAPLHSKTSDQRN